MADRFQRLFTLTPNLYSKDCPVMIEAGALQKDTLSNKVLTQIKMKNISDKTISSCKVSIKAYENNGSEVEGVSDFSYLDLDARPGETFGSKTPIYIPEQTTRSFSASVSEIVFDDGTVLKVQEDGWKPAPNRKPVTEQFSANLVQQLSLEMGHEAKYIPEEKDGLFLCSCGEINLDSVKNCNSCGNSLESLHGLMNKENLNQHYVDRKRQEDTVAKETAIKNKKKKKKTLIACVAVVLLLILMLSSTIKCNRYEKKIAGHTYDTYFDTTFKFTADGKYQYQSGSYGPYIYCTGDYSVKKDIKGYYVHVTKFFDNSFHDTDFYILSETSDGTPDEMETKGTETDRTITIRLH